MGVSIYSKYDDIILNMNEDTKGVLSHSEIARRIMSEYNLDCPHESLRKHINKLLDHKKLPETVSPSCVKLGLGKENILVIGDIHEPFCKEGYLEFCQSVYETFSCNKVIFIGDIIDNHYSSYHETVPEGMGGMDELELAIHRIDKWYKAFPVADVIIGNHDRMIMRKAQSSAIPTKWIKEYKDVLGTPNWNFVESVIYNNVLYVHGEAGTARTKMKAELHSVVQGHLHTQAYCEWLVGSTFRIFGMQVGCGIDRKSYAMAYAKAGKRPAIGCGVVLADGKQPINILMDL